MQGKVCLITGATSGIGLVAARELARQGARVVIVGRNPDRCAEAVTQIQAQTGNREVEALLADRCGANALRFGARITSICTSVVYSTKEPGGVVWLQWWP